MKTKQHVNRYWFCDQCAGAVEKELGALENWEPIKAGLELCGKQSLWGKQFQNRGCGKPATMFLQTRRKLAPKTRI